MSGLWRKLLQRKLWILAAVLLAVIGGGIYVYKGRTAPLSPGPTVQVERGDILSLVSATGTISPVNLVDVSSKISGLIKEVKVGENDRVTVDQVLMVLDDKHLQAQVAQAKARLENAAGIYERTARLAESGAVSAQALDTSRSDYSVAQADYEDAVSQLNDTIIRSPIDGQVIGKPTPAGQAVAPGVSTPMVLLTVADLSKMQIETQVDESDIGKIQRGQQVTFTVDAYPDKTFSGMVSNVSQKATVVSNVVYYKVLVDVAEAGNLLKPTMTARVSIHVGESKNTLTVPLAAVKAGANGQYVVVVKNQTMENRPVTTGISGDSKIEIVSGLSEGEEIVASTVKAQASQSAKGGMMPRGPGGI